MSHAYKTTDLAPDERIAVERLLGRPLHSDEAVEIVAYNVADMRARETEARRQAIAHIRRLAKGKGLGGASVRDLIDEGRSR